MKQISLETISGKNTVNITSKNRVEMNTLSGEKKFRHEGTVELGNRKKDIKLIERKNDYGFGKYSEIWRSLKEVGLPVVPTLRKTGHGTVMMTDLTADGSELYGKELSLRLKAPEFDPKAKEKLSFARYFLKIMEGEEFEKLRRKAEEYKELANKHQLLLPEDDAFELIIHPSGSWDLVMIDLALGIKGDGEWSQDLIQDKNDKSIAYFFEKLLDIKEILQQPSVI